METLIFIFVGFLGVVGHCLFKANSLQKDAKAANVDFSISKYIKLDWFGISASFLMVFVWVFLFGEVANKYPAILDYVRCTFAGMGFFGSYIIQTINSRGKSYIRKIVDRKTDIADKKHGSE